VLTTTVVLAELRQGTDRYPLLSDAANLEWMRVATLDTLAELSCFVKWAGRIGSQKRDLGEASVLAAAELREGSPSPTTAMPRSWHAGMVQQYTEPSGSWLMPAGKRSFRASEREASSTHCGQPALAFRAPATNSTRTP
jgi:hypothetical protein